MVKLHNPAMLVLLETRMTGQKHLTVELKFDAQFQSPVIGQSGGIVFMWKDDFVKLEEVATTPQGVHIMVKVTPSSSKWLFLLSMLAICVNDRNKL